MSEKNQNRQAILIPEREQFEENKVLLWGEKQASSKLLKQYGVGNKNPLSKARVGKAKAEKKEEVKEEYDPKGEYYEEDLPFLHKEYERITKIAEETWDDDILDLQEKLDETIEQLEHIKKLRTGKGVYYKDEEEEAKPDEEDDLYGEGFKSRQASLDPSGFGFKAGSPEAKAHAEKMRKAREAKSGVKVERPKAESKARVEKGSEQAKELGKRLAEAKKAKYAKEREEKAKEEEKKQTEKHSKLKPWYYIGDMPDRYREATEDEAIKADKVSEYGKYVVDETKYYY